jgi:intracellular sulfur oxidation DsrE/DsrF family protein
MNRLFRWICGLVLLLICGLTLTLSSTAGSHKNRSEPPLPAKQKVVYHVSEANKVRFALNNINNHLEGIGGNERIDIVLVVNGGGVNGFLKSKAGQEVATDVELLELQDVRFEICGYSLKAFGSGVKDLVGNFKHLDQGGVVRLVELQQQGFAYLRP